MPCTRPQQKSWPVDGQKGASHIEFPMPLVRCQTLDLLYSPDVLSLASKPPLLRLARGGGGRSPKLCRPPPRLVRPGGAVCIATTGGASSPDSSAFKAWRSLSTVATSGDGTCRRNSIFVKLLQRLRSISTIGGEYTLLSARNASMQLDS